MDLNLVKLPIQISMKLARRQTPMISLKIWTNLPKDTIPSSEREEWSYLVVKNRESPSPELLLESLRSSYSMRLPPLWMLKVNTLYKKPLINLSKREAKLSSLLLIDCPLLEMPIWSASSKMEPSLREAVIKSWSRWTALTRLWSRDNSLIKAQHPRWWVPVQWRRKRQQKISLQLSKSSQHSNSKRLRKFKGQMVVRLQMCRKIQCHKLFQKNDQTSSYIIKIKFNNI